MRIEGSVIVVTGASSGIGRATALELARLGALVVAVSRRAAELDRLVAEIERSTGNDALAAPADVTDPVAVEAAAARAVERFGRIDGWVNSAAVTGFGALLDTPLEDIRRTLEVNVMGTVHGVRAALPRMIEQGGGVVVNVSSILGVVAPPLSAPYAMSKFAVRGLGVSLREELRLAGAHGVAVGTVLPAAIDTPIYRTAYNRTGSLLRPPPPVYSADTVARTIVAMLRRPRTERVAGGLLGRAFVVAHLVTPRLAERLMALDVQWALRSADPSAPKGGTPGNLHGPTTGLGRVDGGWHGTRQERRRRSAALALVGGGVAAYAISRRRA